MSLRSAFVTGATGFVGGNLVRTLLRHGTAVTALVREGSDLRNLEGLEFKLVRGDLSSKAAISRALKGCDACFHVAAAYALPDPEELYRINVGGTRTVLEAARNAGTERIVYTSTIGTLRSRSPSELLRETDSGLEKTASHYVRSKFQGEQVAVEMAAAGAPVVIVHPSAPVGAGDRVPTVTGKRILSVLKGRLPSYVSGAINHVAVHDVAEGMIRAALRGKPGQHYLLAKKDGNLTRRDLTKVISRIARMRPPRRGLRQQLSRWIRGRPREGRDGPRTLACDPSWSIRELDLPQTPLEDAFRESVEWYRSQGMI